MQWGEGVSRYAVADSGHPNQAAIATFLTYLWCLLRPRFRRRPISPSPPPEGTPMATQQISTRCCVVGGGPCGLMLGFLLARAGVDVVVLEKHADFLRDFRGDTIHPSTLDIMGELGLLDDFLKLPHQKAATLSAYFGSHQYAFADFTQLPTRCKFIALMPQWDFLNFLAERGKRYPSFHWRMRAEAVDLMEANGRVTGVRVNTPDGPLDVRADL